MWIAGEAFGSYAAACAQTNDDEIIGDGRGGDGEDDGNEERLEMHDVCYRKCCSCKFEG